MLFWSDGRWVYISSGNIHSLWSENLKKVVLIDMTAKWWADRKKIGRILFLTAIQEQMEWLIWNSVLRIGIPVRMNLFRPMFSDGPCQDEIPWVLDMAKRNTPHVMVNMWLAIIQKDYRDMLKDIKVPCLYTYAAPKISVHRRKCKMAGRKYSGLQNCGIWRRTYSFPSGCRKL